ncbi:nicotinamide riboside transporter PnuC [Sphingobacterium deserti]|uniref:Nicotinamide riboside transporter PnuC n=1 Tax=Sphingobacterium deserti TaxID=1229276 RepID=A0A0B8T537_9SPHI|nr:nicotinamide riboside transporter PnuC [Sphingobacterium deserti]KGE15483.1 nicotinamide mononucleotide transporter PnuC [Sphingobacterium deserti]
MPEFFTSLYQQFLTTTALEWIATLSGFLCVFLAARQNILNWPISIVSVSIYAYIFFQSKLYGDTVLQLYFLFTAFYGWYYWSTLNAHDTRPIQVFTIRQMFTTIFLTIALATIIGSSLRAFTDTDVPYVDGFCTAVSFVAQFLMTRKVLQNWLMWVVVDVLYIPLYIHKDLLLTAILYIAFAIIAWNGYRAWRLAYNKQHSNVE